MEKEKNYSFPGDIWDESNERAKLFFEKCYEYTDTLDDMLSLFELSKIYYILCILIFIYFLVTFILIIIYHKKYKFLNNSILLTLTFSLGGLINVVNSFIIQVYYVNYPCFFMILCTGISYPLLIIPCIAYILNYLKQCHYSNYAFNKINDNDKIASSISNFSDQMETEKVTTFKLLNRFNVYFSDRFVSKLLIIYLTFVIIYSVVIGYTRENYLIYPLEKGFCTLSIEYIPQLFLIFFFFLIFLPFSVIELYKLNDSINMKNSLMFTTIFMFISLFGYFLISLIPSYNCSKFVKYWPSDAFVLLLCISYHYTQITKPLISIIHLKRQAKKLVVSKQGLIKTLQDRILFTEFAEECKKGRCVENILFCVEYKKFKALINNKSHKSSIILNDIDEVPKSPSETEYSKFTCTSSIQDVVEKKKDSIDECRINIDDSKTNNKRRFSENFINKQRSRSEERIPSITSIVDKKKMLSSHLKWSSVNLKHGPSVDDIINRINYIYEKFIKSFSDYELNLTSKVVKKITNTINDLNTMVKDHETISFASLSEMNFDIIFDEAYDEVLDSLYLNVYMQYVVKKQSKPDKKTTANSS